MSHAAEPEQPSSAEPHAGRYIRQTRFAPLGEAGQQRLGQSRALICGCGALGTVLANALVRAGVGLVRIVDRDFVELSNLQRQVLFDEDDLAAELPKAVAAAQKLRRINSQVTIEPIVADVDHRNIESLCQGIDLILDGTDNFETRMLLNDAALRWGIPWVYGGSLGAEGQTMTILPGETPCLRCLIPEPPQAGSQATCDTAGVLGPAVNVIASIQACEALKILSGNRHTTSRVLTAIDLWSGRFSQLRLDSLREKADCRACRHGELEWLAGRRGSQSALLCGRNAVQLGATTSEPISLEALARKLSGLGQVRRNAFLLRFEVDAYLLTIFPDGRAIISGTEDIALARTLYARYVGH